MLGNGFVSGERRLALAPQAMSSDGQISLENAMISGAVAISNSGDRRRKLTRTGTQRVLVIRVVSNTHFPTQSEAKMYDDVFNDDNNLVSGLVASMIVLASITTCYIDY